MYKLNTLQRGTLITTDEVVFHAPTKATLDRKMIEHSIIIAEERFIRPALCSAFYDALVTEKNLTITSGNKAAQQLLIDTAYARADKKPKALEEGDIVNASEYLGTDNLRLWKELLWKLTAECVVLIAIPEGYVQFTSEGPVHNQPTNSPLSGAGVVSPELRTIKWAMDKKLMDRIDPLTEALHRWLCVAQEADSEIYPLYTKNCTCNSKGLAYRRKTDVILGIYDDEPRDYLLRRDPHRHPDCDDCWDDC